MPFRISLLPEYVHVEWYGDLLNEDLRAIAAELPKIGQQLRKVPNILHTFDKVDAVKLQFDAMHAHTRNLSRIALPNRSKTASYCDRPLVFGVARMMQSLNNNPALQMEVFSSLDEALAWLKKPL